MKKEPVQAVYLPVEKLRPFEGHPFQVIDNEEMDQLIWSVVTRGVLTPLVVRPLENGDYEVISGHRRLRACQKAGIQTVPSLVYALDRDTAAIALVDSNLHREHILPSEKAFAYKLKMEAMNHQGTSGQVGQKWTRDEIAENGTDSSRQIQRYIRLTNLEPELLKIVDEGKISLTPAVELSYLRSNEQKYLLDTMELSGSTPSYSQAVNLRKASQLNALTTDLIDHIMAEPKANQKEKISFRMDDIRKYFPRNFNAIQIQQTILALLNAYQKQYQRQQPSHQDELSR